MCYKQKCKVVSVNLAHPVYGARWEWCGGYKLDAHKEKRKITFIAMTLTGYV